MCINLLTMAERLGVTKSLNFRFSGAISHIGRNLSSLNFLVDIGCCLALNIKAVIEVFKCDSSDKSAAKTMALL